jgi:hypothetical protein
MRDSQGAYLVAIKFAISEYRQTLCRLTQAKQAGLARSHYNGIHVSKGPNYHLKTSLRMRVGGGDLGKWKDQLTIGDRLQVQGCDDIPLSFAPRIPHS